MKRIILLIIIPMLLTACGGSDSGKSYTCTLSVSCEELVDSAVLAEEKRELVPEDGVIIAATEVSFAEGDSVFDVLLTLCRENKIHLEYSEVPLYNTAYIEGINNLYEFDAGALSGWVYTVNGVSPNIGASAYILSDGDVVEWSYTVDKGVE